jgi:sialic acid synthase SpsE
MSDKVYVIAEIGINHEGSVEQCARMIKAAAEIGVDAVKLQTIDADTNYVVGSESYKVFKGSELTRDETGDMFQYAQDIGVDIFTTCGDLPTAKWVDKLNPVAWKVSSGLLTHIPMVRSLASFGRPMLISTGMATIEEIDQAVATVEKTGNNNITIFQCTSLYPTPPESLNLASMDFLRERYGHKVGFSDHSLGDDAVFLSVGVGAKLIEKHFTCDKSRQGYDHAISLEPDEFRKMVKRIRLAETIMGSIGKTINDSIDGNRSKYMRTIVALKKINKGEVFTYDNLGVKRPLQGQRGSAPKYLNQLVGCISSRSFKMDEPVNIERDIE